MELTNILGKLRSHDEPPRPFLALELIDELVQAAVWHVDDGVTEVVALGTPVEWSADKDGENLVQAVDATISTAVEGLPAEPNQVVFGLPAGWTNPDGIEPGKLKLVKLVCRELELEPLGFVTVIDSLLRYLKMQEGTPSTSLLIEVTRDQLTLHLVRLGKIEGVQTISRSDDLALDVEEGISHLPISGNLPSRLIIFDGLHNLDELVQNLLSYDWQSKFEFLHVPKVESLPKDIVVKSIAIAGGAEVAKSIGFELKPDDPKPAPKEPTPPPPPVTIKLEEPEPSENLVPAADLGFGSEEELPLSPPPPPKPKAKLKLKLPSLPRLHFSPSRLGGRLGLALGILFLLLALTVAVIWFVPHAAVTIFVEPKNLDEKISLTLSTSASVIDPLAQVVPATIIETEIEGTDSTPATGEKTIGDPARGEVVIYNRTDLVKTFPQGTALSAKGVDFSLDEDVTVASSSAGADYIDVPGKATVAVTAKTIGVEGNLPADTEFTLANYSHSTYVARNSSAFGGGSANTIKVVSEQDRLTLLKALSAALAESAKTQLLNSAPVGTGVYLLEDSLQVANESYSVEVGEEADSLTGTISVQVKGLRYLTTDIEELVASAIQSAIPPNYVRTSDLPTVELTSASAEGEQDVLAEAKVSVKLLPLINVPEIQRSLHGLPSSQIDSALSSVVGMDSARVKITPDLLPSGWKRMPRNPDNISITIQPTN